MDQTMTQMNTRIELNLKRAGDNALSEADVTPSRAVRALWNYLGNHLDKPEDISSLIDMLETSDNEDADRKDAILAESAKLIDAAAEIAGASHATDKPAQSDSGLFMDALVSRYEDRGLL